MGEQNLHGWPPSGGSYVFDSGLAGCTSANRYFEFDRLLINNAFVSNATLCHDVIIRDSLFINGQPDGEFSDLSLKVYMVTNNDYSFPKLTIINSTVQNGLTAITNCCDGQPNARIYNSIFTRSGNEFVNEVNLFLYNNRYDGITNRQGGTVLLAQDNSSAVANLNTQFVPNPGSAMINSGTSTVPGGLSDVDVYGGEQTIGTQVDRGAAESSVDGTGIYTVTNTGPSGAGSLSNAINLANLDGADNIIRFNIAGSCPQRITVIPGIEIRDQLRIDGNSQPGSTANNADVGWYGAPCVILDGLNNSGTALITGAALNTNNESVDISGLAFERFDSAILLAYGNVHRLRGNQFGGRVGAAGPILRANNNAIFVAGEGRSVNPARNGRFGALIEESANNNRIEQNRIGRNVDSGVRVLSTAGGHNLISNNSIDRNSAVGIDLGANGVTDNDSDCAGDEPAANGADLR